MSLDRYGTPSMAEAAQALLSVGPSARGFGEACFAAVSIDGSIVTANRPFCELFGYDVNELVGQSSHILNGDDDPAADRAAARLVRGETLSEVLVKRYRRKDGSVFWGRLSGTAMIDEQSRTRRLLGVIEDLDALVQPSVVDDEARRLGKMLAQLADLVVVLDGEGTVRESIGGERRLLGYPPEYWLHRSVLELMHPDDRDRFVGALAAVIETPGVALKNALRLRDTDGTWGYVEVNGVNLLDDPDVRGVLLVCGEVTTARRAQWELAAAVERAQEATRAKTAFVASTSHELRTPLNGIVGMAELLAASPLPDDSASLVEGITREAKSLTALLDDLLDVTRIETGNLELVPGPCSPAAVAQGVVDLVRGAADDKGLELRLTVDPGVPAQVVVDAERLRQMLVNLVNNAVRFTESGSVTVTVTATGRPGVPGELIFAVTDTGPGIGLGLAGRIFEPFFTTSRDGSGTGLGLAITRSLAELMGGGVSLDSTPGEGSTFRVMIPAVRAGTEDSSEGPDPESGLTHEPAATPLAGKVLVVDDTAANRLVLGRQLARLGLEADVVEDGETAVARCRDESFDLVLMDWFMPGLDGLEATRLIRADERSTGRRAAIVAVTASAMDSDRARCIEAGMDDFLAKPITLAALEVTARRWLEPGGEVPAGPERPDEVPRETVPSPSPGAVSPSAAALDGLIEELGDRDIALTIAQIFLDELPSRASTVREDLDERDPVALRRSAHTLAGPSGLVGAVDLAELCGVLERLAAMGGPKDSDLAALGEAFTRAVDEAAAALVAAMGELS